MMYVYLAPGAKHILFEATTVHHLLYVRSAQEGHTTLAMQTLCPICVTGSHLMLSHF